MTPYCTVDEVGWSVSQSIPTGGIFVRGEIEAIRFLPVDVNNGTVVKNSFYPQSGDLLLRGKGGAKISCEASVGFRLVARCSAQIGPDDEAMVVAIAKWGEAALVEGRPVVSFFQSPGFPEVAIDQFRINGAS